MVASYIQSPLPKSSDSPAVTVEGVASAGLKSGEPSFTCGGQTWLMAATRLANQYGGKYFISQSKHYFSPTSSYSYNF